MPARGSLVALWCIGVASAGTAHAQEASEADRAFEEGRFAEAGRAYADALAAPGNEPARLVQIHLRLGIIAALGGDDASAHFAVALALDPILEAPTELTPELRARFEALREARQGRRVSVRIEEHDGRRVAIVADAPPDLINALRVRGAGGYERRLPWLGAPIEIGAPEPFSVEALDVHGGIVARAGDWQGQLSPAVAARAAEPAPAVELEPPPAGQPSLLENPWLWVAVGVVVLGIGIAIGVSASGDRWTLGPPVLR